VLNTAQLQAIETTDLAVLKTTQIQALSTTQIDDLTTTQVQALTTTQVAALTTAQVRALTSTQIQAIETTDVGALKQTQLTALGTQWSNSTPFTADQIAALRAAGYSFQDITPLVLDLDGNGVSTVSISAGTTFDHDRDGRADLTGWVSSGDGLLVRDLNGDGAIGDGSELFGSFSNMADGSRARDGYEALLSFDMNGDGYIDSADDVYSSLMVWRDVNGDGIADAGELIGLSDLGVARIGAAPTVDLRQDNGNTIGLVSEVVWADGRVTEMADVWFQAALTDQNAIVEALDDALARYSNETSDDVSADGYVDTESDVSLALSSELLRFDQFGDELDLTKGLNMTDVASVGDLTDPEELLRRQQAASAGSLGQT